MSANLDQGLQFLDLPEEIQLQCLAPLCAQDLGRAAAVCKPWGRFVSFDIYFVDYVIDTHCHCH